MCMCTHTQAEKHTNVHTHTHRWTEKDRCVHTHTQAERHKLPDPDRQTAFVYSLLPRFPSVRLPHSSLLVFAFLIAVLFIPSPRASPHMLFMSQIKRSTFLSLFYSRALLWPAVAPCLMRTWSLLRFHTLLVKYHCECDVCVISMWRVLYLKKKKHNRFMLSTKFHTQCCSFSCSEYKDDSFCFTHVITPLFSSFIRSFIRSSPAILYISIIPHSPTDMKEYSVFHTSSV